MKDSIKVGLALGAGSARGLAHIGVLQVLEEHDIPIDMIAGSSMGAVIGSLYACGTDLSLCAKFANEINEKTYMDVVVPRKGFLRGEKFHALIKLFTKNYDFKDVDMPLAVVATDIQAGRSKTFREGKIHEAVRASIAIPAIFEPYEIEGVTYVDAGVLERVPVKAARDMGADIVISVDVGYRGGGFKQAPRNILDIIWMTTAIMEWENVSRRVRDSDFELTPEVRHINPNSFSQTMECIDIGRKCAEESIEEIKKLLIEKGVDLCIKKNA